MVILKKLENIESEDQRWFDEAKSHLTISNKWEDSIVQCHGLTRDPSNGNYMLIIKRMDMNLRKYLHSKNILFDQYYQNFCISDLGFCGPVNKLPKSIYGNLPYIAPEVIYGKEYTFKSDIYSVAMIMWEISSGQPPFINYEHDYDLAMSILVNGNRPKIVSGTPLEFKNLMRQCWDADPIKRPDIITL
ncbi:kinase-like domain-containing protein [Rhizophagus diaphanus]|nr:kinase-like domain-containing protein [Rhizophagus diaphanus] [Rhizophagus sp. MUCL 43196]